MIYYFIFGKDYKEILSQYVGLTGKPIMPPKWALGFAQCRGLLTSEKLSREIAEGYRTRGIPCDIIYQDIGWTEHLQDFEWRKGNYENPKKMLADLKAMGFKVVVSQDPVISQANKKQWEEADRLGYFVKDSTNGKSYDKECMKLFGTNGVPSCVLVDAEGRVVSTNARGGWLNEKLAKLFQE